MSQKVLLIIASDGYQPVEYGTPKQILEESGILVVTASDKSGIATASDGSSTTVNITLPQVNPTDYDGIFFVGGPGALEHLDNQESNRILNEMMVLQKPYGAICVSPRILAKANVLTGKQATGWNDDHELETLFANNNVTYVPEPVVTDGVVITASGPAAAAEFGRAIVKLLDKTAKMS